MKPLVFAILLTSGFINPLFASDATGRIAIGGAGGWGDLLAREDDRRQTNGDLFGSAWLRLGLSQRNELYVAYDSIQLKVKDDSSANTLKIRPITVGLWHSLWPDKKITPIATIGIGGAELSDFGSVSEKTQSAFAAQGGLGLEYFPMPRVSVGALGRIHYVLSESLNDRSEATAYTLGIMANLFWGGKEVVSTVKSAPLPEEPPVMIIPPADADGDDVLDSDDICPNTPAGALVNEEGCPVAKVSVSLDVKFVSGKAALAPGADDQLEKVATFMKKHSETTIVIEGHSDNVGGAAMNKKLSQQRADVVRSELVEKFGIAADRISAKGFGSEVPIASNATPEGRAANRRVVATISASVVKK